MKHLIGLLIITFSLYSIYTSINLQPESKIGSKFKMEGIFGGILGLFFGILLLLDLVEF